MKCNECPCLLDGHDWLPLKERNIDMAAYEKDCVPRTIKGNRVCQACYVMFMAIFQKPHFIAAHTAWMLDIEKLNRLRIGADYLNDPEDKRDE